LVRVGDKFDVGRQFPFPQAVKIGLLFRHRQRVRKLIWYNAAWPGNGRGRGAIIKISSERSVVEAKNKDNHEETNPMAQGFVHNNYIVLLRYDSH